MAGKSLPNYVEAVFASRRLPPKAAVSAYRRHSFVEGIRNGGLDLFKAAVGSSLGHGDCLLNDGFFSFAVARQIHYVLLLRVGAILNRAYPRQNEMVELAGATVDMDNAEVWKNGEKQALTAKEMQLFEKLYQNAGRIVTTGILCETICGEFWQGYESTLSTHIRHLREKIEENPSKPVSLVTVKGLGYRLNLKEVSP